MKRIQQYCNVVNRMRHNPACREEVLYMATRKEIRISRRGAAAGTAVAAALLALNIGGGYLLLSGDTKPENSMVAMSDLAEQNVPLYVSKMQEYYTATSGIPCDFDFTGYGRNFDYTWEDEHYRLTLNAVTGCDWILYYFYDVEPLQGQNWEQFQSEFPTVRLQANMPDVFGVDYECSASSVTTMPNQGPALDDGVWHCVGLVRNWSDVPFSAENNYLKIYVWSTRSGDDEEQIGESFDFLTLDSPLQETDQPWYYNAKEFYTGEGSVWENDQNHPVVELNRYAATPFGVFYVSQVYQAGKAQGFYQTGYTPALLDMNKVFQADFTVSSYDGAIAIDTFDPSQDSYCGTTGRNGEAVSFIHVLFDHPWDPEKGALCIARHDSTAEDSDTAEPAEDAEEPSVLAEKFIQINDPKTGELRQLSDSLLATLSDVEQIALAHTVNYWCKNLTVYRNMIYDDETDRLRLQFSNPLPTDMSVQTDCEIIIQVSCQDKAIPLYDEENGEPKDYLQVTLEQDTRGGHCDIWIDCSEIEGAEQFEVTWSFCPNVAANGEQNTTHFFWTKEYTMTDGVF